MAAPASSVVRKPTKANLRNFPLFVYFSEQSVMVPIELNSPLSLSSLICNLQNITLIKDN